MGLLAHAQLNIYTKTESQLYKVLPYVEYRAVSGVFQNIDPHPLSTQRVCPPPSHSPGGEGVGVNFGRRQTLDWSLTF
jgi:hypothetical protein